MHLSFLFDFFDRFGRYPTAVAVTLRRAGKCLSRDSAARRGDQMQPYPSGDSFKLSPHATDVRLRAPLPEELRIIKCKLHPREMALMYRCTSPMLGRGDSPPPAAAKCEIKFVPYTPQRISPG